MFYTGFRIVCLLTQEASGILSSGSQLWAGLSRGGKAYMPRVPLTAVSSQQRLNCKSIETQMFCEWAGSGLSFKASGHILVDDQSYLSRLSLQSEVVPAN